MTSLAAIALLLAPTLEVPAEVTLGEGAVEVRVTDAPSGMRVLAGTGTLAEERVAGGTWSAHWKPPEGKAPRVAILAAVSADGTLLDWKVIPLVGEARVVSSSKPFAKVRLRVAGEEYGPLAADAAGKASFQVRIPPGVTEALLLAEDRVGGLKETPLPLDPPPFSRVFALCAGTTVRVLVAGTSAAPIVTAAASAREKTSDVFSRHEASREKTSDDFSRHEAGREKTSDVFSPGGVWAAEIDATEATADEVEVTASLEGEPASRSTCLVSAPPEEPSRVSLRLSRDRWIAGSAEPVEVAVSVEHPGRRSRRREVVPSLRASAGSLSELESVAAFQWRAQWSPPDKLPGAKIAVTASAGTLSASQSLAVAPAEPAVVRLTANRKRLLANGRDHARVRAEVFDRFGNAVPDVALVALATSGEISAFDGGVAELRAPRLHRRGHAVVTARDPSGAAEGVLDLPLVPSRGRLTAAIGSGWQSNLKKLSAPFLMANAGWRPPIGGEQLSLGIETGFLQARSRGRVGGETVVSELTATPAIGRASWDFVRGSATAYAGGGAGVLVTGACASSETAARRCETYAPFLATAFVGAERRVGRGIVGLELAWREAKLPATSPVRGTAGGLTATVSFKLDLER